MLFYIQSYSIKVKIQRYISLIEYLTDIIWCMDIRLLFCLSVCMSVSLQLYQKRYLPHCDREIVGTLKQQMILSKVSSMQKKILQNYIFYGWFSTLIIFTIFGSFLRTITFAKHKMMIPLGIYKQIRRYFQNLIHKEN